MIAFGWTMASIGVGAAIFGCVYEWWRWRPRETWRDRLDELVVGYGPYVPQSRELIRDSQTFSSAPYLLVSRVPRPVPQRDSYQHNGYTVEPVGRSRWRVIEDEATNHGRTFHSQSEANEHIRMRCPPR